MSIHHLDVIAASALAVAAVPKPTRKQVKALRMLAKLRGEAEAEIERLIEFLDRTELPERDDADDPRGEFCDCYLEADDADKEGEPTEDMEPSLGWTADGSSGAPTNGHNDECEAGCPPAKRPRRRDVSERLDNFGLEHHVTRKPRIRRSKPSTTGICNVGPILASWQVRDA